MPPGNRARLIALIAAGTKLDAAARLAKEAVIEVRLSGLLPLEDVQKIVDDLDAYVHRIITAVELIP